MSGALLTHIDLMRLKGEGICAFARSLTPFAFAECCKTRMVAVASLVSFQNLFIGRPLPCHQLRAQII